VAADAPALRSSPDEGGVGESVFREAAIDAVAGILLPLCYFFTRPGDNVNFVFGPEEGFEWMPDWGWLPLLTGGMFLDYAALAPAEVDPAALRYFGILVVELAIGLAVFGAMLLIFDVLVRDPGGGD
jgi:hypothetical protein